MKYCKFQGCGSLVKIRCNYCGFHQNKATVDAFLSKKYSNMQDRVSGKYAHILKRSTAYAGLPILQRQEFYDWAKNCPELILLYNHWLKSGFNLKLTPTVDRWESSKGYILGNMRWLTNSENCGLTGPLRKQKREQAAKEATTTVPSLSETLTIYGDDSL